MTELQQVITPPHQSGEGLSRHTVADRGRCDSASFSLLTALSGHNSELFHSDFLAYLGENHPVFFRFVMSGLLGVTPDEIGALTVCRELNHTDLALCRETRTPKGGVRREMVHLIENKFKSDPSPSQLYRYLHTKGTGAKSSGTRYHLLTLITPAWHAGSGGSADDGLSAEQLREVTDAWHTVTYANLAEGMRRHADKLSDAEPFVRELTARYADFIAFHAARVARLESEEWETLSEETLSDPAIPARIPYLRLKREIARELERGSLPLTHGDVQLGTSYSHGTPLFEAYVPKTGDHRCFVQYQDGVYRVGLVVPRRTGDDERSQNGAHRTSMSRGERIRLHREERVRLWRETCGTPLGKSFQQTFPLTRPYDGAGYLFGQEMMLTLHTIKDPKSASASGAVGEGSATPRIPLSKGSKETILKILGKFAGIMADLHQN